VRINTNMYNEYYKMKLNNCSVPIGTEIIFIHSVIQIINCEKHIIKFIKKLANNNN